MTRWMVGLALLISGCTAAPAAAPAQDVEASAYAVELATVQPGQHVDTWFGRGEVSAPRDITVAAAVAGTVSRILFAPGTAVQAQQALVQLDSDALHIQRDRAQAQVALRKAAWEVASRRLQRRQAARDNQPDLIKREELETIESEAQMRHGEWQSALADLREAELKLRQATIRAPAAGVMQSRPVRPGQYVTVGTPVGELATSGALQIQFFVPATVAAALAPGSSARIDARAAATVHFVAAAADAVTRQVEVHAKLAAREAAGIRPGSNVAVDLALPARQALHIPRQAVFASEAGPAVYVAQDGVVHRRGLTVVPEQTEQVEVLAGLQAGEQVVVQGHDRLHDGARVQRGAP